MKSPDRFFGEPGNSTPETTWPSAKPLCSVATYNVHRWVGMDGVRDVMRVLGVIKELQAGVIGLQEVSFRAEDHPILTESDLAGATGMQVLSGPTMYRQDSQYGNVLLTAYPILDVRSIDLSVLGREPRGALDVDLDIEGKPVRVIVTHFGLKTAERRYQAEKLVESLSKGPTGNTTIVLADLNEWLPGSPLIRRLCTWFRLSPAMRTYPSRLPLLPLDRILVRPVESLAQTNVYVTPASRVASDHLPLCATISDGQSPHAYHAHDKII